MVSCIVIICKFLAYEVTDHLVIIYCSLYSHAESYPEKAFSVVHFYSVTICAYDDGNFCCW